MIRRDHRTPTPSDPNGKGSRYARAVALALAASLVFAGVASAQSVSPAGASPRPATTLTDDEGTLKTLHHLLTREVSHTQMFMKALDDLGKLTEPLFGNVAPDDTVDVYFNLSHGEDERGPWNSEPAGIWRTPGGMPSRHSVPLGRSVFR